MKKVRLICLLLALVLALNCAAVPAYAAPEETTQPSETTIPSETTVPVETEPTMPPDFTGDASVAYGSRTLDAQKPLADTDDYKAEAKAALLYELNSDTLVFAQDVDEKLYPASLTKVMTALLTLEMQQDLDAVVTVTRAGLQGMEPGGSNVALQVGEQMSVRDLLYCLMVKSGNDAASVLAVQNSGSIEAFVEVMNQRAAEMGCTGTHFMNPHGLHHDDHYTTARDMAKIMKAAMEYPLFEELISTVEYTVPVTNLSEARVLKTTNYLIRNAGYPTVLDSRVIGGKTGNTSKAGRCLVALSEKDGMKLVSVILGAKGVNGEDGYSFVRYGNFEETSDLLDFGFGTYTTAVVLTPSQVAGQFAVSGGEHNAFGMVTESMSAAVPQGSDYNTIRYEYTLAGGTLTAPIEESQEIGLVRVWYGNTCLAQQVLRSASNVAVAKETKTDTPEKDDSEGIWHTILVGALIVLAVVLVGILFLRARLAARRRRRRRNARRRAAAQAQQERPRRRR